MTKKKNRDGVCWVQRRACMRKCPSAWVSCEACWEDLSDHSRERLKYFSCSKGDLKACATFGCWGFFGKARKDDTYTALTFLIVRVNVVLT